jgi:hypothetical protein
MYHTPGKLCRGDVPRDASVEAGVLFQEEGEDEVRYEAQFEA